MSDELALSTPVSAGALLRAQREAQGLHIAALAVALKVPVKKIEALEADRLDLLPDTVFVRALASSVCRALKMDPAAVLSRLPQSAAPALKADESGVHMPQRQPVSLWLGAAGRTVRNPLAVVIALMLLGALGMAVFPLIDRTVGHEGSAGSMPTPSLSAPGNKHASPDVPLAVDTVAMTVAPTPVGAVSGALVQGLEASSAPSASARATDGPAAVVFKARGASWVEVIDARGVVQARKTLIAGESLAVSGARPLAVVVGRTDTTDVEVLGRAFDLAPYARDQVARFEVK